MTECPHCGCSLPSVPDPFCPECREALDEPVLRERTPAEKAASRKTGQRQFWIAMLWVFVFVKVVYWGLRLLGEYYHPR